VFRGRPYLKYLFLPTPWILGALFFMVSAHKYKEVSSREQTTTGTIILHEPENHNRYGYRFQVDGRAYTGWETPLKVEPKIGQSVTVHYDPLNPAQNALTDFSARSDRASGPAVAILLLSAVFIAAVLSLGPILSKSLLKNPAAGE
jgi:hypothetical protein